ncbi:transketolase [Liquorilactobacillus uvarum]|uniref:Transketolase n=1 Tax=Liquorilactobacillus uvarum DSM 19971 TaxID=1423812 RepID=A0A0R1Q6U1_9LACO|nr:transketolase [Liquorilactobacillus uvarum]KRL36955.1 transketolase [Liquorilactobacillus uvarum DSM 19971]
MEKKSDTGDKIAIDNLRMLSVEMVQKANSGHPGLPLGAAPMAWTLWSRHLRINAHDPKWFDRDRFVLSAGHGSALLYSLLHLSGFDITMDDLKHFRKFGSKTPGHPEYGLVPGVEATTGPLGQGLGMAVGMALAEVHLAEKFNKTTNVIDHHTYVLASDGDLMEGVSHEAASFAGNQKLSKLIVLYDSNNISLDGPTSRSFKTNVRQRFESYGWDTFVVTDGNNVESIDQAIVDAKKTDKPTLIEVKTTIGFGTPDAGTNRVHGNPLGIKNMAILRERLSWTADEFTVLPEVENYAQKMIVQRGRDAERQWNKKILELQDRDPELLKVLKKAMNEKTTTNATEGVASYENGAEASRDTSHKIIQSIASRMDEFVGGSADLASSNKTTIENSPLMTKQHRSGRNIAFGVREFAQGTILNGMALHGGMRVFGGTFLVFSDYMRGAIRLAALQKLPVTYVFTHDSIAVGEDGPTHQPIEQLMSLRVIPNVVVLRPADPNETIAAWQQAITSIDHPTALILTRQKLPVLSHSDKLAADGVACGGYVISPQKGLKPVGILLATGSEVYLAIKVQQALAKLGQDVSVVSMPSMELFEKQSVKYQEQVLPSEVRRRVAIEMGTTLGWQKFVGLDGSVVGIDHFGASGAEDEVISANNFTVERIAQIYQQTHSHNEIRLSVIG